jgi:cell division protein FtsB
MESLNDLKAKVYDISREIGKHQQAIEQLSKEIDQLNKQIHENESGNVPKG